MTSTTASTGTTLDLRRARHDTAGVGRWHTKAAALATLAALRECGRNRDRSIQMHHAETFIWRFWVIGRPDHYNGITYLMTGDGRWIAGRLTDNPCYCKPLCPKGHEVPWTPLGRAPEPATVTHDYSYSAGSVGVCGHDGKPLMSTGTVFSTPKEILAWHAFAWCVACTWKTNDDREDTVRARARWHREHPHEYQGHNTPRRLPA